jgi:hypothetical protein
MYALKITVSGPGMTFLPEFRAIRQALEAMGCKVTVEDDHPEPDWEAPPDREPWEVRLIADHQPWGG